MTYTDLIGQFEESCSRAARFLGKNKQTVHRWKESGIPEIEQLEIQKLTKGKLKADPSIVAKFRQLLKAA